MITSLNYQEITDLNYQGDIKPSVDPLQLARL